jgi:hypothetical protein
MGYHPEILRSIFREVPDSVRRSFSLAVLRATLKALDMGAYLTKCSNSESDIRAIRAILAGDCLIELLPVCLLLLAHALIKRSEVAVPVEEGGDAPLEVPELVLSGVVAGAGAGVPAFALSTSPTYSSPKVLIACSLS